MNRRVIVLFCLFLTTCGKETTELQRASTPVDAATLAVEPGLIFRFEDQLVGQSKSQIFTLKNTGKKTATQLASDFGLSITFSYPGGFPGTDGTCGTSLAPGESCLLQILFSPQYVGAFEQSTRVSYYNGYSYVFTDYPILKGNGS